MGNKTIEAIKHYNLGNRLVNLKREAEAIKAYTKAIGLDPDFAQAYNNRGNLYANKGKHAEAVEDYKNAIKIDPTYAKAHNNLGVEHAMLKDYKMALKCFSKAIGIDPEYNGAYNNRERAIVALGTIKKQGKYFVPCFDHGGTVN